MKRIDQQEIENENKNETGAVLLQGPPQENPSWENDPNTKLTRPLTTSSEALPSRSSGISSSDFSCCGRKWLEGSQAAATLASGAETAVWEGVESSKKVWFITGAALWGKVGDGSWEGAPP